MISQIYEEKFNALIVDDTPFNIEALISMFEDIEKFEIYCTFNGELAIEMVENFHQNNNDFKLIFMDINMPVIDGLKATKIL